MKALERHFLLLFSIFFVPFAAYAESNISSADYNLLYDEILADLPDWSTISIHTLDSSFFWYSEMSVEKLLDLVDEEFDVNFARTIAGWEIYDNDCCTIGLNDNTGSGRYNSSCKKIDFDTLLNSQNTQIVQDNSFIYGQAHEFISPLAIDDEILEVDIQSVMLAGSAPGEEHASMILLREKMLVITRQISGVTVLGSRLILSINPLGDIERMSLEWPDFYISAGAGYTSRSPQVIAEEATEMIIDVFNQIPYSVESEIVFSQEPPGLNQGYSLSILFTAMLHDDLPIVEITVPVME